MSLHTAPKAQVAPVLLVWFDGSPGLKSDILRGNSPPQKGGHLPHHRISGTLDVPVQSRLIIIARDGRHCKHFLHFSQTFFEKFYSRAGCGKAVKFHAPARTAKVVKCCVHKVFAHVGCAHFLPPSGVLARRGFELYANSARNRFLPRKDCAILRDNSS